MQFRLITPDGQVLDEGDGVAELVDGALVMSPRFGQPLRVAPADIVAVGEPEPYTVLLTLADGPALELRQLGAMRTHILAGLAEARASDVTDTFLLGGVGKPETFPGVVDEAEAELRLYDDALVVVPARGDGEKVPYPFIKGVRPDESGYRIAIDVAGREPLVAGRLARRTTEFTELLTARHREAAVRTSAFLAALLPGLGPTALRGVAGLLRDGLAGAKRDLDAVDATVWPALVAAATRPDRVGSVAMLAGLGEVYLGFKQTVSVRREAEGVTPWRDPSVPPNFDHGGDAGSFGGGVGGMAVAGIMAGGPPRDLGFGGPFPAMGAALALSMLGSGGFGGSIVGYQHQIRPRADVERGRLTPAHADLDALTAAGEAPTVLSFALCLTETGFLVYEGLNEADHATYVYRAPDGTAAASLNRALDLVGFKVEGIDADAALGRPVAGSRYRNAAERLPALRGLREAYVGRVVHTESWATRLIELVG